MRPRRETFRANDYAYFVSTQTAGRKPFFRHERWARLMLDVVKHYDGNGYELHAYVVMPDHLHLLITPFESVEKSVQLIKGGFSFRAKRELDWKFDIWQPGFTDHRIRDEEDWKRHLEYMRRNPIEARLVEDSVLYEFMGFPNIPFPQGLKPRAVSGENVRPEGRTLQPEGRTLQPEGRTLQPEGRPLQPGTRTGTAQAAPFQSSEEDVRAVARTLQDRPNTRLLQARRTE